MGTVTELAGLLYDAFETARRTTGDTADGPREDGETYVRLRDGSPDWMRDAVHDSHGGMFPDDWRYECVRAAAAFIADNDDESGDMASEFADGHVDTYTGARLSWLASNLNRLSYVDDAVEDLGHSDGVAGDIGLGQYQEAYEVYSLLVRSLEGIVESLAYLDEDAGVEMSS